VSSLNPETEPSLISYLASSLPIGNHANQEKLGATVFRLWEEKTFNGTYLESLPQYKVTASLEEMTLAGPGFFDPFRELVSGKMIGPAFLYQL
jgi:hypothetical protein